MTTRPLPLTPMKGRVHLTDELASILREEIVSGKYSPGERLPTEAQISTAFGVSRAVVREAISRLKHDGLIEAKQGLGAFVSQTGQSSAFRIDVDELGRKEIGMLFELRTSVEVDAAGLAARRRTAKQIDAMRTALEDMRQSIVNDGDGSEADAAFHQSIADGSANRYFREFMRYLEMRLRQSIAVARANSAQHKGWQEKVQLEHAAIFSAIEAGDAIAARAAMRQHLVNASGRLRLPVLEST